MAHIFISYSRKDTEFVEKLERDLGAGRFKRWRDTHSIVGGQEWYDAIVQGLHAAYVVVQIVTVNSEQSRWVKREGLYADQLGLKIIPVLPVACRLPPLLIETQPILFEDYAAGLAQLVAALETLPKMPSVVPDIPGDGTVAREAYLKFVLGEWQADLHSALYVSLLATPEWAAPKAETLRRPGQRRPKLDRLGLERVHGEHLDQPGTPVADAREPLREMKRVLLLGEPGAGKTTTLLQLAIDLANAARDDANAVLPVVVPLRSFQGEQPFGEFVQGHLHTLQSRYEGLLRDGRLVLLCDALNEMQRRAADGRDLVGEVREYLQKQAVWVVTG